MGVKFTDFRGRPRNLCMMKEEYDVSIVGAGAAGSLAAQIFSGQGLRVQLLDAGPKLDGEVEQRPREFSYQTNSYVFSEHTSGYFADDRDLHMQSTGKDEFQWMHARGLGGRTLLWQGVCPRFTEREFETIDSGAWTESWPIGLADIEPYYRRVEQRFGVQRFSSPSKTKVLERLRQSLGIEIDNCPYLPLHYRNRAADFRQMVGSSLAAGLLENRPGVTIRCRALATKLCYDSASGRAEAVRYVDLDSGRPVDVTAKVFLLCASTLESTRILQNSTSHEYPRGIGSHTEALGRFLMSHLKGASLTTGTAREGHYFRSPEELFYAHFQERFCKSREFQRGWGLQVRCRDGGNMLKFNNYGEDLPCFDNSARVDRARTDRWGRPRLEIAYRYGPNEEKMRLAQIEWMQDVARRLNLECYKIRETFAKPGHNNHEVWTARMGKTMETSVLNERNQVWSCRNVYVTDGACFTTSGYQNPTLTILALTWRACEDILRRLNG